MGNELLSEKRGREKGLHRCLDNNMGAMCPECNTIEEGKLWSLFYLLCKGLQRTFKQISCIGLNTTTLRQHRLLSPFPFEEIIITSNLVCLENELKVFYATMFLPRYLRYFLSVLILILIYVFLQLFE